jgi:cytochrome d ubiquinol oxidase subunit II
MTLFDVPAMAPSALQILWLILIAVLWIGFFFLEGFDFGVGMLVPFIGKNDQGRRLVINTIGPHWDGNEVWLLTAGGAMFAAFPGWYATLFSGLYLPLFLVLLGLIIRGVAFEYRSKREDPLWRSVWDWCIAIGSFLPALVFGVGFANFVRGLAVENVTNVFGDTIVLFAGSFWGLFLPFCLIGGLLFVSLFVTHGAFFIGLKTTGEIHDRAQKYGGTMAIVTVVLLAVFVVWANLAYFNLPGQVSWLKIVAWVAGVLAIVAMAGAWFMNSQNRDGWAFIGSALATVTLVAMMFAHFYPGLGFNNGTTTSNPIDITTASSSPLTLTIMTWAAGILVPIVLAYTVWSYFFVFRRRLSTKNIPALDVTTAA